MLLDHMLERYGLPASCLEIVPDIQAWCKLNGREESNSSHAAKCLYVDGTRRIVMRDEQTDSMIASAKSAMDLQRAFDGKVATLDSDRKYLVHLILHEIAYFMLNTPEQEPRDDWAFKEMPDHAA